MATVSIPTPSASTPNPVTSARTREKLLVRLSWAWRAAVVPSTTSTPGGSRRAQSSSVTASAVRAVGHAHRDAIVIDRSVEHQARLGGGQHHQARAIGGARGGRVHDAADRVVAELALAGDHHLVTDRHARGFRGAGIHSDLGVLLGWPTVHEVQVRDGRILGPVHTERLFREPRGDDRVALVVDDHRDVLQSVRGRLDAVYLLSRIRQIGGDEAPHLFEARLVGDVAFENEVGLVGRSDRELVESGPYPVEQPQRAGEVADPERDRDTGQEKPASLAQQSP